MNSVRWQRGVPERIRTLEPLSRYDYADLFAITIHDGAERSAEDRMRAALGRAPIPLRALVSFVQGRILGLRLGPWLSPDHVLGWRVADRGDDWFRMEADSWLLTGHVVCQIADGEYSIAAFVRYHHRLAALIWPLVTPIHRYVGRTLLRSAATMGE